MEWGGWEGRREGGEERKGGWISEWGEEVKGGGREKINGRGGEWRREGERSGMEKRGRGREGEEKGERR